MTNSHTPSRWSKNNPSWGSPLRRQRNHYAYLVAMVMTGGRQECPSCEGPMPLSGAASQVDRVDPALDYCEGNIVLVCESCNQDRSRLQTLGRDWPNVEAYASHVADASAMVDVPTQAESKRWAASIDETASRRVSKYA